MAAIYSKCVEQVTTHPYFLSDVDECSRGLDNCGNNSQCNNTVGSFSCRCNHGYSGDGVTCNGE